MGDAKLHRQTGLGSSFLQSIPSNLLEHSIDATGAAEVVAGVSRIPLLHHIQPVNVLFSVWVPDSATVLQNGPNESLVGPFLGRILVLGGDSFGGRSPMADIGTAPHRLQTGPSISNSTWPSPNATHQLSPTLTKHHISQKAQLYIYQQCSTRTNYFKYSFFPYTTVIWNNLPYQLVNSPSVISFKAQVSKLQHIRE